MTNNTNKYKKFADNYLVNRDKEIFDKILDTDKLNIFIDTFMINIKKLYRFIGTSSLKLNFNELKEKLIELHIKILFNSKEDIDDIFNSIKNILDITTQLQVHKLKL